MITLEYVLIFFTTVGFSLTTSSANSEVPNITLSSSNVPTVDFNDDAISTLTAAYVLYPNDLNKRLETFSELYTKKHQGKWIVVEECSMFYFPVTPTYIDLNVVFETESTIVKMFTLDEHLTTTKKPTTTQSTPTQPTPTPSATPKPKPACKKRLQRIRKP